MTLTIQYDKDKDKGQKIDPVMKIVIKGVKMKQQQQEDDFFLIVFGDVGSGKSNLILNAYEEYAGEDANIDFVTLNQTEFANATKKVIQQKDNRFLANDEAYISSRRGMSSYNVDLIGWYMANRGLKIFHIWANPSIKMLDKDLIKERVDALIYIPKGSKNIKGYRNYYYFKKDKILDILEKAKSLELKVIHKYRNTKAKYRGWFEEHQGRLKEEYRLKKVDKMQESTEQFSAKYGLEDEGKEQLQTMNLKEVYTRLGISKGTFIKYEKLALADNIFNLNEDYIMNATGSRRYSLSGLDKLKSYINSQKTIPVVQNDLKPEPNYLHARGVGDA